MKFNTDLRVCCQGLCFNERYHSVLNTKEPSGLTKLCTRFRVPRTWLLAWLWIKHFFISHCWGTRIPLWFYSADCKYPHIWRNDYILFDDIVEVKIDKVGMLDYKLNGWFIHFLIGWTVDDAGVITSLGLINLHFPVPSVHDPLHKCPLREQGLVLVGYRQLIAH